MRGVAVAGVGLVILATLTLATGLEGEALCTTGPATCHHDTTQEK